MFSCPQAVGLEATAYSFPFAAGTDLLVISHGFGKTKRYSDTYAYSLSRQTWTKVKGNTNEYNPNAPHARCLVPGSLVTPTSLVMYGGCLQASVMCDD